MIVVKVRDRDIKAAPMGPVTTGSVGLPVSWHFDESWDELSKIAVFRMNDTYGPDMAILEDVCIVPNQLLVQDNAGENLWIGVYGRDLNGEIAVPTIWTYIRIEDGAVPQTVDPTEPTPEWPQQVQDAADEALRVAHGVRQDADDGAFDGASAYEQAVEGGYTGTEAEFNEDLARFKDYAQDAETAAETAETAASSASANAEAAENAQAAAEAAKEAAETAEAAAEAAASAAGQSETNAGGSASQAAASAAAAEGSALSAEAAKAAAASSVADAEAAKTAAETAQEKAEDAQAAAEATKTAAQAAQTEAEYSRNDAVTAANTAGGYSSQARQAVNQAQSAMNAAQRAATRAAESAAAAQSADLENLIAKMIAPVEDSFTATRNYGVGAYLYVKGTEGGLYRVKGAITSGEQIADEDIERITIGEELMRFANLTP